jgi:hypothetical protein
MQHPSLEGVDDRKLFAAWRDNDATVCDMAFHGREFLGFYFHDVDPLTGYGLHGGEMLTPKPLRALGWVIVLRVRLAHFGLSKQPNLQNQHLALNALPFRATLLRVPSNEIEQIYRVESKHPLIELVF